jgi:hypothetical protein
MLLFTDRELSYDLVNGNYPSAWLELQNAGKLSGVKVEVYKEVENITFFVPRSPNSAIFTSTGRTTKIKIDRDWVSGEASGFAIVTDNEYKVSFKAPLQHFLIDKILEGQEGFNSSPVQALLSDDPIKQGNWDAIRQQSDPIAIKPLDVLLAELGSEKVLTSLRTLRLIPIDKEEIPAYRQRIEALQKDLGEDRFKMLVLVSQSIYGRLDREILRKQLTKVIFSGNKSQIVWELHKEGPIRSWGKLILECENGIWRSSE